LFRVLIVILSIPQRAKALSWTIARSTSAANGLLEARKFQSFFERNHDARYGNEPLAEYMKLDPHYARFGENLVELRDRYPGAKISDEIAVQLANLHPSRVLRISQLRALSESKAGGSAVDHGLYLLGVALQEDSQFEESREALERLRSEFPDSVWAIEATKRLETLRLMSSPSGQQVR
jgi:hypothetical protein